MSKLIPFRRGRFEALPELPHIPHDYHATRTEIVRVDSAAFGSVDIHARVLGSGPPLLLVHGLMTTSYSWRYVFAALAKHFTVWAPDLPGAGRSDKPLSAPYHPIAMARWIAEFQRAVGIRGCDVIGNSMGGYLCMQLALDDPDAMSRLVNVHSPGVPEARLWALRAALGVPGVRSLLSSIVRRDPLRWVHRNVHYYDESLKSLEEARAYGEPLATPEGAAAFGKFLAETLSPTAMRVFVDTLTARRAAGQAFPVPLLLLYAEHDPMVPPRIGSRLAELIPDARFARLREASHFAHVDAVARFLPPVLDFLGVAR